MTILLYHALTFILSLFAAPVFLLSKRGRFKFLERFGLWGNPAKDEKFYIWFHAASAGEMNGLAPVVEQFKEQFPEEKILITSTSNTGFQIAQKLSCETHLLCFDSYFWISLALKKRKIKGLVIAETEFWPGLLSFVFSRSIPVIFINARISLKAFGKYKIFYFFLKAYLNNAQRIFTADKKSIERFIELGAVAEKVAYLGNAKYDLKIKMIDPSERESIKNSFFVNSKPIITLGSLRPGEEKLWLDTLSIPEFRDKFNLIIIPRHLEKLEYFKKILNESKLKYCLWNDSTAQASALNVVVVTSFGWLNKIYSFTDLAFVGGTIVNIGGHNPIEACIHGTPIVIGKYYQNISEVIEKLQGIKGIFIVSNKDNLAEVLHTLLLNPNELKNIGLAACQVTKNYAGITKNIVDKLAEELSLC